MIYECEANTISSGGGSSSFIVVAIRRKKSLSFNKIAIRLRYYLLRRSIIKSVKAKIYESKGLIFFYYVIANEKKNREKRNVI